MWLITILYVFIVVNAEVDEDASKCPTWTYTAHYRDFNCKPINNDKNCPIAYECPVFDEFKNKPDKCLLNSDEFNNAETVPNTKTSSMCAAECRCSTSNDRIRGLSCANIECPDGWNVPPKPGCYYEYNLKHCCAVGEICPLQEKSNFKSCTVDDKTYKHGQKIYPNDDNCKRCVCNNGELDCEIINCGTMLRHGIDIALKTSAPIYYNDKLCCPIDYAYYTPEYEVITLPETKESDYKCTFGNLTLNIGDGVKKPDDKCIQCTCAVPPILTCFECK